MKDSYFKLTLILLLINFTYISGNAQQQTDETTYIINQYFQSNKEASALLENKGPINSIIQSPDNLVKLNQIGDNNQIEIKGSINDAQSVGQFGNSNNYHFINYYNSSPSNFNIMQQGNSNSLQIYGENSIIKNISILQKTDFKTLIIKNY